MEPYEEFRARQIGALLNQLCHHWGDAYDITVTDSPRVWRAARRDNGEVIERRTARELDEAINGDYSRHPVPREAANG